MDTNNSGEITVRKLIIGMMRYQEPGGKSEIGHMDHSESHPLRHPLRPLYSGRVHEISSWNVQNARPRVRSRRWMIMPGLGSVGLRRLASAPPPIPFFGLLKKTLMGATPVEHRTFRLESEPSTS